MKKLTFALLMALLLYAPSAFSQGMNVVHLSTKYVAWGEGKTITGRGNYVYVALGDGDLDRGISVVDVSVLSRPFEVGYLDVSPKCYCEVLTLSGNYLYAGYWNNNGWLIADVSNPNNPTHIYLSQTPANIYDIATDGDLMYMIYRVSVGVSGMRIYDVSSPAFPVLLSQYVFADAASQIALSGNYAYIAEPAGIGVMDVSDPTHPTLVESFPLPGADDVAISGNIAFVNYGPRGFCALDITNPLALVPVGWLNVPGDTNGIQEISLTGNLACIGAWQQGVFIVDVSQPANMMLLGNYHPGGVVDEFCTLGNTIFYSGTGGFSYVDITTPQNPTLLGTFMPSWFIKDVVLQGNYAYLCAENDGFLVLDVTNPKDMIQVAYLNEIGSAVQVLQSGDYAYVATVPEGMCVIDVADPRLPTVAATYPDRVMRKIQGNLGFSVTTDGCTLEILDLTDPANISVLSTYTVSNRWGIGDMDLDGHYLYALFGNDEQGCNIMVLDVANPVHPVLVGTNWLGMAFMDITISGGYAYLTSADVQLRIYDISNPQKVLLQGTYTNVELAGQVNISGNYAYTTQMGLYNIDLNIIDVSNPLNPFLAGAYNTETSGAYSSATHGDFTFLADGAHLESFDCADAVSSHVQVLLTPEGTPIQIPPGGRSFNFSIGLVNPDSVAETANCWCDLTLPDGSTSPPVLGPFHLNLLPGADISRRRVQNVPAGGLAGHYTFHAYATIGAHTYCDAFPFFKLAGGGLAAAHSGSGWENTGESFPKLTETQTGNQPHEFSLLGASPNPFNLSTDIRYQMPDARQVNLKVFDTAGRLIATLVDGWREAGTHEVTFDGSRLASGIYLAKLKTGEFTVVQKMVMMK